VSAARTTWRAWRTLFVLGFQAAPGWMVTSLLVVGASGLAFVGPSYGLRLLTDGVVAHDRDGVVAAVAVIAGSYTFFWLSGILAASVGSALQDRVSMEVTARVASLVSGVPGLEHLERPEYLRELELLDEQRVLLGAGPRQGVFFLRAMLQLGATVVLLATVHPLLAVLPALGALPFFAQHRSVAIRQRLDEELAERRRLAAELFALSAQAAPAKEVRTYGLADELARRHREITDAVSSETAKVAARGAAVTAAGWAVFAAGLFAGLLLVVHEAARGRATAGEVLMAIGLAQLTQFQLTEVSATAGQLLATQRTVGRYLWLYDHAAAAARRRPGDPEPVPARLIGGVDLVDVTFRYPGTDVDVLRDVTVSLPAGATVALVGENGAGKTTLVKLLTGMYEPSHGAIRVNGVSLDRFDVAAWRARTSAAFQDAARYEMTAARVIGIGDLPRLDDAEAIGRAVRRSGTEGAVGELAEGMATPLGRSLPGGRDLSGGQWQQLALGRSMMRDDPLLLVLDEPTASLDALVEHQLFSRYRDAAQRVAADTGAITLLVTHRLASVRMADLVVVLAGGRVVEVGTHDELVASGGTYAELFELQARSYR
jgi:ATP-binding cassette, subfamily B, bacterial